MSNNAIPDATRPHEVSVVMWVPEDADPREIIRLLYEYAETLGAEPVSDDWTEA